MSKTNFNLTMRHLLAPITLLSVTVFFLLSYQTTQILRDRDALNMTKGQQQKAFEDASRLQEQLKALLLGTQKLTDEGNKNTKVITEKLKEMGIHVQSPTAPNPDGARGITPAPVPPATEKTERGPVKP